jgi:hypothetical protein
MKPDQSELLVQNLTCSPSTTRNRGTLQDIPAYINSAALVCVSLLRKPPSSRSGIMSTGTSFTDAPDSRNLPADPQHVVGA